jgi:hypothetical protein
MRRYTRNQMARRLLAFSLALVIIGGPLAGDVCEAFCAEHVGHSIDPTVPPASHHHHSAEAASPPSHHHHSDGAPVSATQSARLMALPHWCGHLEAIVSESRELTRASGVTAVVTLAGTTPLLVHVLAASGMDSRHGPPNPIRSIAQLRI